MSTIFIERTVNLNGPIIPDTLNGVLNCGEVDSHEFTISATLDNEPFALSGVVTASFIRSDGVTVPLTGSISDGAAVVVLNNLCYNVPGRFAFTVFITSEGVTTAIYGCTGTVRQTDSGSIVDPGEIIPSVSGLITAIENAIAEIPADYSQLLATQAPTFSPSTPYVVGSYVWYDGTLYRFTAAHAAGSWTGSDAKAVTIGGELAGIRSAIGDYGYSIPAAYSQDLNDVKDGWVRYGSAATNKPDSDIGFAVTVTRTSGAGIKMQIAFTDAQKTYIRHRAQTLAWDEWKELLNETALADTMREMGLAGGVFTTCDDAPDNSIYFVSSSGGVSNPTDFPFNNAGWLETIAYSGSIKMQIAYPYNYSSDRPKYRAKQAGTWGTWALLSVGNTTTITREVSADTYNNTYNITTSPTITTDTNGWLQPVDTDTEDETGKTDMTGAIMSMLNSTGYCHLAPGIYYVSGSIDMPIGSTLEGCGNGTTIRLLQSAGSSAYICRMKQHSNIRNIVFSGSYASGDISDGNIGGRNGIIFIGNRSETHPGVTPATTRLCRISNCWFRNLDSGIYGNDAGGGIQQGMIVENCYFSRCKAGINLDYWTEYCKFTDCITFECYYACINNGGNNIFTGCTFHGVEGFVIDNSGNDKNNNAHGSAIGCVFNHIDNINNPSTLGGGIGIKILNAPNGFVFSGCQLWYSRVYVEDSPGILLADCLFGGGTPKIETVGEYPIFLDCCIFKAAPTFDTDVAAIKSGCRMFDGTAV